MNDNFLIQSTQIIQSRELLHFPYSDFSYGKYDMKKTFGRARLGFGAA